MSDHERLLRLLKDNPSTWFATYEIAERLGIQANTAQRCINSNLKNEPIERRRRDGERVKEYRLLSEAHTAPPRHDLSALDKTAPSNIKLGVDCLKCGASDFYSTKVYRKRGTTCSICGKVA